MATDTVLSLHGVSKRFGAVQALTDVDLDVSAGEVVALVGDNGAGKSTLVKMIAGVYSPTTGTMTFDGEPVRVAQPRRGPGPRHRHRVPGPRPVRQPRRRRPTSSSAGSCDRRALDEVEMERESWQLLRQLSAKIPSVRIPIAALSGGQRQTVAIARCLVGEPKVVMLDEPTAALGVAQTAEVLNLVERLRESGLGVILISHNMADVRRWPTGSCVLRLGRNSGEFDVGETTTEESSPRSPARPTTPSPSAARVARRSEVIVSADAIDAGQPADPAASELPAGAGRPAGRAADRRARRRGFVSALRAAGARR